MCLTNRACMHDRNTVASNTTADSSTTLGRPACKQFSLLFNRVRGAVHPVCTLSSGIGPAFAYQHILCGVCTPIMIFIYLGGGRSQLWLTLLGLAVTLILNSGFLSNQSAGPAEGSWAYRSPPARSPWQGDSQQTPSLNLTWAMPLFALLVFIATKAYVSIQRQGLRRTWHEFCDSVWSWRGTAAGQPAPHNTAVSKRRRFEAVSKVVQQLPVELHASQEELRRMSLPELKRRLTACGVRSKESFDKEEAIARIVASANSSSTSCTVCCDDYESGDALRILKCGHKYHVECIDKWLLCSTDYLRAPTCPICSAAIIEEH